MRDLIKKNISYIIFIFVCVGICFVYNFVFHEFELSKFFMDLILHFLVSVSVLFGTSLLLHSIALVFIDKVSYTSMELRKSLSGVGRSSTLVNGFVDVSAVRYKCKKIFGHWYASYKFSFKDNDYIYDSAMMLRYNTEPKDMIVLHVNDDVASKYHINALQTIGGGSGKDTLIRVTSGFRDYALETRVQCLYASIPISLLLLCAIFCCFDIDAFAVGIAVDFIYFIFMGIGYLTRVIHF